MVASDSDSNKVFGYIINQILCKRDLGLGTDSVWSEWCDSFISEYSDLLDFSDSGFIRG